MFLNFLIFFTGRRVFRRTCHHQGRAGVEVQLPPHRRRNPRPSVGPYQEQEAEPEERQALHPRRVRQDARATW